METVSGANNWKLVIRREAEGVTILRAETCDGTAALPEELFGLPVTALGHHALAANRAAPPGEEVLVTCGLPGAGWDNGRLRELQLPASLRRVGDYAFLNCGRLKTLSFTENIAFWGGGCFMNCRELDTFHIRGEGEGLAYIADELSRELDVTLRLSGGRTARLIFPEYIELYEENCPAHHFDYSIYGAGYPYHHCFRQKRLQLADYDGLWPDFLAMEHSESAAGRMAFFRLRDPADLGEEQAAAYRAYLSAHAREVLCGLVKAGSGADVAFFLREGTPGGEALEAACALARELGRSEALALLLEEQHRRFPPGRRKAFDL